MTDTRQRAQAQVELRRLYDRIDEEASRLTVLHDERLQCRRGCSMCCVDDITVAEVEADHIRAGNEELLSNGTPHAVGMCAFLNGEGACRIYAHRPYVCRTQGLPLRWEEVDERGGGIDRRDICVLNEEGTPIVELPADDCWRIGWAEGELAQIQGELDGRDDLSFDDDDDEEDDEMEATGMTRVSLRELFA